MNKEDIKKELAALDRQQKREERAVEDAAQALIRIEDEIRNSLDYASRRIIHELKNYDVKHYQFALNLIAGVQAEVSDTFESNQ